MILNNKSLRKIIFTFVLIIFIFQFIFLLESISALNPDKTDYGNPIIKENYIISREIIDRELIEREVLGDSLFIENKKEETITISISASSSILDYIEINPIGYIIPPLNKTEITFSLLGKNIGNIEGELIISGSISEKIPIRISIRNESSKSAFNIETQITESKITRKQDITINLKIKKLLNEEIKNVSIEYFLIDVSNNKSYLLEKETKDIIGSVELRKQFKLPSNNFSDGEYILEAYSLHQNKTLFSNTGFSIYTPFLEIKLFGKIPIWFILAFVLFLIVIYILYKMIAKYLENKRKYKMELNTSTLQKKGDDSLFFGKVAEKNIPAYYDMNLLTTHCVVAGATGGGKSIAAQVIIEEALRKNIAVLVFDPTAQWSGMLRKCTDKKMMSYYSKFGLKQSDSQAFLGNVRQIKDARQKIDVERFIEPGKINIFTMNKLKPSEIDTFVASVIAGIFRSDPKEHPGLRTILVFDEVHRLLPKFGGSGKGFLQIERACREFRKWGFGVLLVSQVLSDFVGEIKANINTEVQMRTRDESDLNRLKTKYGEEVLQSLVKASVGVGMFVNPRYNRGKPFFINFRPILHNTRRLSDEELDKYNKYSEIIDDVEYQTKQLENEKVDVFDLKMELKLVKDKLMTGNFTVVDIYLEGLLPRLQQQWKKINKTPQKKEIELVDEKDIEMSLSAAQKEREKWGDNKEKGQENKT